MTTPPDGMLDRALAPYPPPRSPEPFGAAPETAENRGDERPRSFSFCPEVRRLDEELDRRRAEEAGQ